MATSSSSTFPHVGWISASNPRSSNVGARIGSPHRATHVRGYRKLYDQHIEQAHRGCDFDFLRGADSETLPEGLFDGWVGGW